MEKIVDNEITISLDKFAKAPEGSILVKGKGLSFAFIPESEITEEVRKEAAELKKVTLEWDVVKRTVRHFKVRCKSHFCLAFAIFKMRAMMGDIDVSDADLRIDEDVLEGRRTIGEALEYNKTLKSIFVSIFGEEDDEKEVEGEQIVFPEV